MLTVPLKSVIIDFSNTMNSGGYVLSSLELKRFYQKSGFYMFDDIVLTLEQHIYFLLLDNERVIIHAEKAPFRLIKELIDSLTRKGYEIYIHASGERRFQGTIELQGDHEFVSSSFSERLAKYSGIILISDIHAVKEKLRAAINIAERRNLYMIFLGDVVDYGGNSRYAVENVYQLLINGKCELILGNHDKRILKWINAQRRGFKIPLSDANMTTVREIENLSYTEKLKFFHTYKLMVSLSRTHLFFDNVRIVHAAYSPEMEKYRDDRYLPYPLEQFALVGDFDKKHMKNTHYWINDIPPDLTVFVAHEVVNKPKKLIVGKKGGKCYMIDMGCGKNGFLQLCHLQKKENGNWEPVAWNIL